MNAIIGNETKNYTEFLFKSINDELIEREISTINRK